VRVRPELAHPWRVSTGRAEAIQRRLAAHVRLVPFPPTGATRAAGVDVAYSKDGRRAWAAAVVMSRDFQVVEEQVISGVPDRSYAPGLLAFREGALTVAVLERLASRPDVVFLDGHGTVHERGLGLASHIGVLLDVPTVGVPKTPFHAIDHLPAEERGSYYVLTKEWGAQGASLRLRTGVKPVYVSPGHRTDLPSATRLCLEWSTGRHKVPEPLAAAHTASVRARNGALAS